GRLRASARRRSDRRGLASGGRARREPAQGHNRRTGSRRGPSAGRLSASSGRVRRPMLEPMRFPRRARLIILATYAAAPSLALALLLLVDEPSGGGFALWLALLVATLLAERFSIHGESGSLSFAGGMEIAGCLLFGPLAAGALSGISTLIGSRKRRSTS